MSQRSNGIVKVPRRFEEVLARNEEWIQSGNLVEDNPEFGRKPSNAFRGSSPKPARERVPSARPKAFGAGRQRPSSTNPPGGGGQGPAPAPQKQKKVRVSAAPARTRGAGSKRYSKADLAARSSYDRIAGAVHLSNDEHWNKAPGMLEYKGRQFEDEGDDAPEPSRHEDMFDLELWNREVSENFTNNLRVRRDTEGAAWIAELTEEELASVNPKP